MRSACKPSRSDTAPPWPSIGISFQVGRGQTVGLLGGNGAGKSTTIAMLLAILVPSARAASRSSATTWPATASGR